MIRYLCMSKVAFSRVALSDSDGQMLVSRRQQCLTEPSLIRLLRILWQDNFRQRKRVSQPSFFELFNEFQFDRRGRCNPSRARQREIFG